MDPAAKNKLCWICKKEGHTRRMCPMKKANEEIESVGSGPKRTNKKTKENLCWQCKLVGHFASECSMKNATASSKELINPKKVYGKEKSLVPQKERKEKSLVRKNDTSKEKSLVRKNEKLQESQTTGRDYLAEGAAKYGLSKERAAKLIEEMHRREDYYDQPSSKDSSDKGHEASTSRSKENQNQFLSVNKREWFSDSDDGKSHDARNNKRAKNPNRKYHQIPVFSDFEDDYSDSDDDLLDYGPEWDTLGEPTGKYDFKVKYSVEKPAQIQEAKEASMKSEEVDLGGFLASLENPEVEKTCKDESLGLLFIDGSKICEGLKEGIDNKDFQQISHFADEVVKFVSKLEKQLGFRSSEEEVLLKEVSERKQLLAKMNQYLPPELKYSIKKKIIDSIDISLKECSMLEPYIHWQSYGWPGLQIEADMAVESLKFTEAGLTAILEVDLEAPRSSFPGIVQRALNLIKKDSKFVTFQITSTIMEYEDDGMARYPYQIWDLRPTSSRELVEPQKLNSQQQKLRWKMYEESKHLCKAIHIGFLKAVLEKIVDNPSYVILGDGRMFVSIWSKDIKSVNDKWSFDGNKEAKQLLLKLVDQDASLNFRSETMELWKQVDDYSKKLDEEAKQAMEEMNWDIPVNHSQVA